MQSDKERIEQIIREQKLNNIEFCSKTALSPSTLSHILSERTKPTLPILRSIVDAFPDLNPMWILLGEGEMTKSGSSQTANGKAKDATGEDDIDDFLSPMRNGLENSQKPSGNGMAQQTGTNQSGSKVQYQTVAPENLITKTDLADAMNKTLEQMQKPQRKVTEVRIFFDDGTFECFTLNKSAKNLTVV